MDQPPILQAEPAPGQKVGLGRLGLYVSLAPWVALAVLVWGKPG
jgi:hypothetical protein